MRQLLSKLRDDGIHLWVHEGRLRISSAEPLKPERMAEIRRQKADIIAQLQQPTVSQETPLCGQPRPPVTPLSYAQEGLWFLDQLDLLGPAYNFRSIVRIDGDLDPAALRRAFDQLVRRHEILRTRYGTVEGVGAQFVDPAAPADFEQLDLAACTTERRDQQICELLRAGAELDFDLELHCPFRVQLLRLDAAQHLLVINMHHIMIDGPSLAILYRELDALYGAAIAGEPPPLPELRGQYADYAIWQRNWLQGELLERQLSYWRSRLAGATESLDLPFDFVRPAVPDFDGAVVVELVPGLESRRTLAREQGATLRCCWPRSRCCCRAGAASRTSASACRWTRAAIATPKT